MVDICKGGLKPTSIEYSTIAFEIALLFKPTESK